MTFPASNWVRPYLVDMAKNATALDFDADTIKCALFTDSVTGTFNFNAAMNYGTAPWDNNEVSATGYTAGGVTLTSCQVAVSGSTVVWTSADAVWTITGLAVARGYLVYDSTIGAALFAGRFSADRTASGGGAFTIPFASGALMTLS